MTSNESTPQPANQDIPGEYQSSGVLPWRYVIRKEWYDGGTHWLATWTPRIEIVNNTTRKAYVTGVCSWNANPTFVDFNQQGAFALVIYPNETKTIYINADTTTNDVIICQYPDASDFFKFVDRTPHLAFGPSRFE